MIELWTSLDTFEKILWGVAGASSLVFIIQSVLTFTGMDAHDGTGAELHGSEGDASPFQLFSFRNMINFLLGFGWAGISLYNHIDSRSLLIFLSILGGLVMVALVMLIFFYMSRLSENGNIYTSDSVGKTGIVYVPISGNKSHAGKIQITINGATREYDALTEGDALKTGDPVIVLSVIEGNLLLVRKLD
ncbi:MAG: hypothetical protein LBD59_12260 [Prevotellaceae bacterium]|jgi:membrane protein implicated in regulation of membrane protease activity|nr:hypothetical protein [Prevotellaceae bacterium]